MEKVYRLSSYKFSNTEALDSGFSLKWQFNDCLTVLYRNEPVARVMLNTFTDGILKFEMDDEATGRVRSVSMIRAMCLALDSVAVSIMERASYYSAYERALIEALEEKLEVEAGAFLIGTISKMSVKVARKLLALTDEVVVKLNRKMSELTGEDDKSRWMLVTDNILKPAVEAYLIKCANDGFLLGAGSYVPPAVVSTVESAFNRKLSALIGC